MPQGSSGTGRRGGVSWPILGGRTPAHHGSSTQSGRRTTLVVVYELSRTDARRIDAIHEDVPFTKTMAAAIRREIKDLARWLSLELALPR